MPTARSAAAPGFESLRATWTAVLLGVGTGWIIGAFAQTVPGLLQSTTAPPPPVPSASLALSAALAALAAGVRIPQQFALWVYRSAVRGDPTTPVGSPRAVEWDAPERSFCWTVLSVLTFVCGFCVGLLAMWQALVARGYSLLHAWFVWSDPALALLAWLTAFLAVIWPVVLLGVAFSCLCHLGDTSHRTGSLIAWSLVGASAGLLIAARLASRGFSTHFVQIGTTIPFFTAALVAALANREGAAEISQERAGPVLERNDRRSRRLRTAAVALAALGALILAAWTHQLGGQAVGVLLLGGLGLGALASGGRVAGDHSEILFGRAAAFAGLLAGAGALLGGGGDSVIPIAMAIAGAVSLGHALELGRTSVSMHGCGRCIPVRVMARFLVAGAFMSLVGPALVHRLGFEVTLASAGLALVGLGSILSMREPHAGRRLFRRRIVSTLLNRPS